MNIKKFLDNFKKTPLTTPVDRGDVKERAKIIVDTLGSFGIDSRFTQINYGPTFTQYVLSIPDKKSLPRIASLHHDIALGVNSVTGSVRMQCPIPGTDNIGVEIPNNKSVVIPLDDIEDDLSKWDNLTYLKIPLGIDVKGKLVKYDITRMPHMLIAGATGSGKSQFLHSTILSLMKTKSSTNVKFILVDPKRVEFGLYKDSSYLATSIIFDLEEGVKALLWLVEEMERRYKLLEQARTRNVRNFNEKAGSIVLPFIVVIIDEFSSIMTFDPVTVEKCIMRVAQLAKATNLHMVLSTSRPSKNIYTRLIKANIPTRAAFSVASYVDSKVIIDQPGAEKLMGKGDMLFVPPDSAKPIRLQGIYVSDQDIDNELSRQKVPQYIESLAKKLEEPYTSFPKPKKETTEGSGSLYKEAVEVVISANGGSTALLQRKLSIGYARAARIMDLLEEEGVVGKANGSKPREVIWKKP